MNGVCLTFFCHELAKQQGVLTYEWLLELAQGLKVAGGSAFRAMAGFGRGGKLLEEHFFELGSDVPVQVVFYCTPLQADALVRAVQKEELKLIYTRHDVEWGVS